MWGGGKCGYAWSLERMITDVRCSVVGSVPFAPKLRNALAQALHLLMVGVNDPGKRHLVKRNTNIDVVKGSIGSITQVKEQQDHGRKAEETEKADQTDGPTAEVKGANEDPVQCEQGNGGTASEEQTEQPDEAPREEVEEKTEQTEQTEQPEEKKPTDMNTPMPVEPVPAPSEVVEPEVAQFDHTRETMEVEIKENMPEKPEEKKCESLEVGEAGVEKTGGITNISDTAKTQKGSGIVRFFSQIPKANAMVSANDADVPDRDPILDLLDQTKQHEKGVTEELGVNQHNENKDNKDNEDEKTPTPMGEKDASDKDKKKDKSDKEKKNKHEKKDKDKDKDKKKKDKKDEDAAVKEKAKDKKDKEKKRKASPEEDEDLAAQTALALLSCQVPQKDGEATSSTKALAKTVAKAAAKTLAQQKAKAKAKAKPRAAKAKASPTSIKTPKSPKQRRRGGIKEGQHAQDPNKDNLH